MHWWIIVIFSIITRSDAEKILFCAVENILFSEFSGKNMVL